MIQSGWIVENLLICWIKYLIAGLQHGIYEDCLIDKWRERDISGQAVWCPFPLGWSLVRVKNCFHVPQSWAVIMCHIHTCWIHFMLGSGFESSYQNVLRNQLTHQFLSHVVLHLSISFCVSCVSIWAGFLFCFLRDHVAYQVSRESQEKMGPR